jgi:riboflavin kinase/FMN adenylyltransferase
MVVNGAQRAHGTPVVLTFDPHPVKILAPHVDLRFLTSPAEKLARFEEAGVQEVIFLPFTSAFAGLTPAEFASGILHDGIGIREIFVGEHFSFGKGRTGKIHDLIRLGGQFEFQVHPVQPVRLDGDVVSSTRIRQLIQVGEMEKAARFLGRPYAIDGIVIRGHQRGQALGWPTANLALPAERVIPSDGVYAAATIWQEQRLDSVVYIGTRPTFGAGERMIEVYLLDREVDLYGQPMTVQFIDRLRGDLVFDTAEALAVRIEQDVREARSSLRRLSQTVGAP